MSIQSDAISRVPGPTRWDEIHMYASNIHLPDCHVFANFPLKSDSIGLPVLLDFSPSSGYMAVGNSRGKALLYRLGHYKNY